jgi:hypothetical protein
MLHPSARKRTEYRRLNCVGVVFGFSRSRPSRSAILVCVDLFGFSKARLLAGDLPGRSQHPTEGLAFMLKKARPSAVSLVLQICEGMSRFGCQGLLKTAHQGLIKDVTRFGLLSDL